MTKEKTWQEKFKEEFGISLRSSGELKFAISFIEDLLQEAQHTGYQRGLDRLQRDLAVNDHITLEEFLQWRRRNG